MVQPSSHRSYDSICSYQERQEGSADLEMKIPMLTQSQTSSVHDCHPINDIETIRKNDLHHKKDQVRFKYGSIQLVALTLLSSVVFSIGYLAGSSSSSNSIFQASKTVVPPVNDRLNKAQDDQSAVDDFLDEIHDFFFGSHDKSSNSNHNYFPLGIGGSKPERPLIYLNRPDAYDLLMDDYTLSPSMVSISQYSTDFFLLGAGLDVQINQAYCAAATTAAVLNSLRFLTTTQGNDHLDIPVGEVYNPYPYATQVDIFNSCTEQNVVSRTGGGRGVDGILTPPFGLSMTQVAELLKCHLNVATDTIWDSTPKQSYDTDANSTVPSQRRTTVEAMEGSPLGGPEISWSVQVTHVDKTHLTLGKVRFDLKNALADFNSHVIVNYDRDTVNQVGGGHWSPLGSYSEKEDAFLVLDVAKYKYTPAWIPIERLFDGMATWDECGVWDFPQGQDRLTPEERTTHDPNVFSQALEKLGCQRQLRGYIIITRT